jgi:hypothetical protein
MPSLYLRTTRKINNGVYTQELMPEAKMFQVFPEHLPSPYSYDLYRFSSILLRFLLWPKFDIHFDILELGTLVVGW